MRTYYIYKVTNDVNGKSYIGKTSSFKQRKIRHLECLPKEDCEFHRAIQEFGQDNFTWEIIDTADSDEEAVKLERYYIKKFDTHTPNGYNMNKGGVGGHNARPVVRLSLQGDFIKRYDSAGDAKADGFLDSDVLVNCKNKSHMCKGFTFMFEDDYKRLGAKVYKKPESTSVKKIIQCDMDGNFIKEFESVTKAANELGIARTRISSALIGCSKTAGNYIFVYKEDFPIKDISKYKRNKKGRKVAQVNPETGEIIEVFDRMTEAGEKLGINYKNIQRAVDFDDRTSAGYKWISQ